MVCAWFPVVSVPASAAHDGLWLGARAGERQWAEVRIRRESPEMRLDCLVREGFRRDGGRDDLVRAGLAFPFGGGRLVFGHLTPPQLSGPGWTTALSARRGPRRVEPSLGRAMPGAAWAGIRGRLSVAAAVGRGPSGQTIAAASLGTRALEATVHAGGGWSGLAVGVRGDVLALPARVEAGRTGSGWRVRGGLGGGAAPLGLLVESGGGGSWRVAGGMRVGRGAWHGSSAEVGVEGRGRTIASAGLSRRSGSWRLASELRVRSRSGVAPTPRARVTVESRILRTVTAVSVVAPATSVTLRLESGPPRSRAGLEIGLPARRGRRIAMWLARATRAGELRARIDWNKGEPVSVELQWGRADPRIAAARD